MGTFEPSYPFLWKKMAETNKQKKTRFFVENSKIWILKITSYKRSWKMGNFVKFHQNICIFQDFTAIYFFCVFVRIWPEIWIFFIYVITSTLSNTSRKFYFFMSEMPRNVVNCQISDFPPGRNQKIQIPLKNPFSSGTLNSDSPQTEPFGKSWFFPKILGINETMNRGII